MEQSTDGKMSKEIQDFSDLNLSVNNDSGDINNSFFRRGSIFDFRKSNLRNIIESYTAKYKTKYEQTENIDSILEKINAYFRANLDFAKRYF